MNCFANACIQALAAVPEIVSVALSDFSIIPRYSETKLLVGMSVMAQVGLLCHTLGQGGSVSVAHVTSVISQLNLPEVDGDRRQDAHDFLLFDTYVEKHAGDTFPFSVIGSHTNEFARHHTTLFHSLTNVHLWEERSCPCGSAKRTTHSVIHGDWSVPTYEMTELMVEK